MEYCDVCGGEILQDNEIKVCSQCGHPALDETAGDFLPLKEAYTALRAGDFEGAMGIFSTLSSRSAAAQWGIFLCRYGIRYERSGGYTYPVCTILRRKRIFDDKYFKKAISLSEGERYEYYKYEGIRIENVRRGVAYTVDVKKKKSIDYYAYEPIDDAIYERDISTKKKVSWVGPIAVGLALVGFTAGLLTLLLDILDSKQTKDTLYVTWEHTPKIYAGQNIDDLRESLSVYYVSGGQSTYITDYTIKGDVKAGDCSITIGYLDLEYVDTITVLGVDGSDGLLYRDIGMGYEVSGFAGTDKEVVLPYYYLGKPVVSIGAGAFLGDDISTVVLHNQIIQIGERAFAESNVESMVIPSSIQSIGFGVFEKAEKLESVRVDSSILGSGMFSYCSSLTHVDLKEGLTEIPSSTFGECSALFEIKIPSSVKIIGSYAFAACTSLRAVYLPMSLELIDSGAFAYIGEIAYPHYEGNWDAVLKAENWCLNTTIGPFMDY